MLALIPDSNNAAAAAALRRRRRLHVDTATSSRTHNHRLPPTLVCRAAPASTVISGNRAQDERSDNEDERGRGRRRRRRR